MIMTSKNVCLKVQCFIDVFGTRFQKLEMPETEGEPYGVLFFLCKNIVLAEFYNSKLTTCNKYCNINVKGKKLILEGFI